MGKQKLVVVGNGMAGVRCVEEILKLAPDRFEITIFGSEPHPNYNRIMLSKVLQGDTKVDDITINDWQWYKDNDIVLYTGETVVRIDTKSRLVVSDSGRSLSYDHLIIATGSLPFMLPLPGADKPGVTAFRDIKDCQTMLEASKSYKKAVVIGGGLLGLEAARGLLNLGMEVHVVHIFDHLMERQLTPTAAGMLRQELEKQGMRFLLKKQTEKILGKKRVEGLLFKDGSKVEADLVVIAVGVRPNIKLAADSGIETNRAIVVNDYMETDVPNVYAVGECAEHRGMVYGLVAPLYEQGKVLAKKICGVEAEAYEGSILYSQLKVSGVEVFSAGEIRDAEITTSVKAYDGIRNTYKKISVRDNKIVGAVLFGDSSEGNKLLGYIKQQADISVLDNAAAAGTGGIDEAYVCSLSDKETVCSCNGVTKGTIMDAVCENGLETVEEVRACTRASSTCGGCKPLVSAILQLALQSKDAPEPDKETVCACTTMDHEELRTALRSGGYTSADKAMNGLGWLQGDGCSVCRPVLSYYIGSIRSSVADEEASVAAQAAAVPAAMAPAASLLADGTYAVVPRMYGGVTSAEQLRQIADVMEKYNIPLAKLAGGAHLDLLGIDSQHVGSVGAELGMAAGAQEYGRSIASVATCLGIRYDGSAIKDSVAMGAALERKLEHLQMPAPVYVAVSSSPLHRAGTLTKDLGIVGVPGGWEIYVGGSGNAQLRQGQLLSMESVEARVLELSAAFLQWYRENAYYGETTGQWIERVGLLQLREALFNLEFRADLLARLDEANGQSEHSPINPQPSAALIR
ncbi:nitrite reductase large subunit NirB [Paenibacillus oenotherae]|uniref:Nitrite reductase large subunit NirB n=1 Tax=Paenibacillus oenotherae TaxID=1435645 RepID=A0ABS7D8F4_9BACL|nr:nitrite reductase large subunit NirB [Paenibacillus oenotherae]MBW7475851.1 nitrite reductase large subunit NirB [Paenibacillus oenotherae]